MINPSIADTPIRKKPPQQNLIENIKFAEVTTNQKEMRFMKLLKRDIIADEGIRPLAIKIGITPGSLHSYVDPRINTEPRLSALEKISAHYHEPLSAMVCKDDLTAEIITVIHRLNPKQKKALLKHLKTNHKP